MLVIAAYVYLVSLVGMTLLLIAMIIRGGLDMTKKETLKEGRYVDSRYADLSGVKKWLLI